MIQYQDYTLLNNRVNEKNLCLYQWILERYGLGYTTGLNICAILGFDRFVKKSDLSKIELYELQQYMESMYKLDSFLKKEQYMQIEKLIKLKTYRGLRHKEGLPVRGQLSRSNGRTQRLLRNKYKQVK